MSLKCLSLLLIAASSALVLESGRCAEAQTINAASCNASDVQAAFNAVSSSTTTINIPAGTCEWTTQVTLTIPSGSATLSVVGAGNLTTTGGGDQTVIVDSYDTSGYLLGITTGSASSHFRLAGITFQGGSGAVKYNGFVQIGGSSQNIRFDHSHYDTTTYTPANNSAETRWTGCTGGVVDHSIFDMDPDGVNNAVQAYNGGSCYNDSLGAGNGEWAQPTSLGSSSFLYMEDNVFNNGASDDCLYGGRFVSRFNTFNTTAPAPTVQTHPTGSATQARGCRAWEVYNNQFDAAGDNLLSAAFFVSAGTGVVWGNTIPSSSAGGGTGYTNFIQTHSMRRNDTTYPQIATPIGWGYCGTSFNGTGSPWDQNSNTSTGYHCLDQPGQGMGDLISGALPNTIDAITEKAAWPNDALEPIYEWMDNYSSVPDNPSNLLSNFDPDTLFNNTDYYLWCNAASQSGCTSFNGTVGVGSGPLESRPATCTTGVAYWATDQGNWNTSGSGGQGELFKCTATNTWTLFYTPYTYPHPLVTGSASASAPAAPVNLTAVAQ
jgi:hypothetical protein